MNSMPGAGSGSVGGYGGLAGGGMPGGMPAGAQQTGVPVDHQQMMMQRQQHMLYMQQQQQAAVARGMYPQPVMQQQPSMMQQQGMYGMQQQPMDPASMHRFQQAQVAARQKQQQQMQQMHPINHQQMLENYRNMPEEQRQAMMQDHQKRLAAHTAAQGGYPPGMQPAGGAQTTATQHLNAAMNAGHMGSPQPQQQSGSSRMSMAAANGVLPSHYIKQESMGGGGTTGTGGMMGAQSNGLLMNVKQEPSLHIKQEPGVASSSMVHSGGMQQQGAADDSPQQSMQHMQPANMRVQGRQAAVMRGMAAQQQQQASVMQGSPGSMVDPSMTVQQLLAAKAAEENRMRQQQQHQQAAAGHAQMQQMQQSQHMDPAMQQQMQQRMMYQQLQQQHQQQQQGMAQMQAQQQRQQQMYPSGVPAAASMGPPPSMQQPPFAAAPVPVLPPGGYPPVAAVPTAGVVASADDEETNKFKNRVEALKEKYGVVVDRCYKRAEADLNIPRFIKICRELFNGERGYSRENLNTVSTLEKRMDTMLANQSITAGIIQALDWMVTEEAKAIENGEVEEKSPSSSSSSPSSLVSVSSRVLPDPWPLDVRARRIRVPNSLCHQVRARVLDERLVSRRKRHAEAMREEEGLPLWSARRLRHESDLDRELEELESIDPSTEIKGSPLDFVPVQSLPPPLVNSIPKSDIMEETLRCQQTGRDSPQLSRLHAKMPEEAMKELCVLRWRMVTDERLMFADTTNFMVAIAIGETAVPPLHVVIPADYPARPATVLFEKTFPKAHAPLRRLGEVVEARLATVPLSAQGRLSTMADVYKATCEDLFGASRMGSSSRVSVVQQQEQSPSPSSISSSTSTSPADLSTTVAPPTIPMLHHLPTTYRPQPTFRAVDGNAKTRMVY